MREQALANTYFELQGKYFDALVEIERLNEEIMELKAQLEQKGE